MLYCKVLYSTEYCYITLGSALGLLILMLLCCVSMVFTRKRTFKGGSTDVLL